jgi:hypothetical protein
MEPRKAKLKIMGRAVIVLLFFFDDIPIPCPTLHSPSSFPLCFSSKHIFEMKLINYLDKLTPRAISVDRLSISLLWKSRERGYLLWHLMHKTVLGGRI